MWISMQVFFVMLLMFKWLHTLCEIYFFPIILWLNVRYCQGMTSFPLQKCLRVFLTLTSDTFGILWTPTASQFQKCFGVLPTPSPSQQSPTLPCTSPTPAPHPISPPKAALRPPPPLKVTWRPLPTLHPLIQTLL